MIKGVNKKIIEINNPDSIYFERAVFYLKPNVVTLPEAVSRSEMNRFMVALENEYTKPRYRLRIGRLIITLLILAAIVGVIFFLLIK